MTSVPDFFQGFAVDKPENWNKPKLVSYKRKRINPTDVVVKNICCGVCGSDVHTVLGSWSPLKRSDLVVGHEIIGNVIAVGDKVTEFKVGQRVGIGASSNSCGACERCTNGNEQYCFKAVATYNAKDFHSENYITQGGYSSHSIANEQFVFAIPEKLESAVAAPLMCAGLTVYSPLVRNLGKNAKGKTVGVIGIGGLGHLAIQFASALGAEVIAFSRHSTKKQEALEMGANGYISTSEEPNWKKSYFDKFDFILNCSSDIDGLKLSDYLNVLKVNGSFTTVGLPPAGKTFKVSPFSFIRNGATLGTSLLGNKHEAQDMLELAAENGVKPWIETVPINESNCETVLNRFEKGDVRYRFVLTNFDQAFNGNKL